MILSNTNLQNVQNQVRENALESFEFFANSVLASALPEDLCSLVHDALVDTEDVFIRTVRPRSLAIAITGWLASRGIGVLTTVVLPQHEILHWLDLQGGTPKEVEGVVTLDVHTDGVVIQWL